MTSRVLAGFIVALLVLLPTAQHASAASTDGHAATLKHAPRTPPASARTVDVARTVSVLPPTVLAGATIAGWHDPLSELGLDAPIVPPRV
jgi:hypothetical protein